MCISKLDLTNENLVIEVANMYCRVFGEEPWNERWEIADALLIVRNPILRWWILKDNEKVIGFIAGCMGSSEVISRVFDIPHSVVLGGRLGYKAEIGVDPEWRRRGKARLLANQLLSFFSESGVDQFLVRTRPGTKNYPWYAGQLDVVHTYQDGRVLFSTNSVPKL